jgi:hypothetical protein
MNLRSPPGLPIPFTSIAWLTAVSVYENPADESRAPELWKNSAQWLKVERLVYIHVDVVKEMVSHLYDLAGSNPKEEADVPWLGALPDEFDKVSFSCPNVCETYTDAVLQLTGQWERDVMLPTTALSDLMYKSVGIRDARHSLQLGLSMWRLSWITFMFVSPLDASKIYEGLQASPTVTATTPKYPPKASSPH